VCVCVCVRVCATVCVCGNWPARSDNCRALWQKSHGLQSLFERSDLHNKGKTSLSPPCRMLQCVAVCCSVLQCVAVCCSVLQCVAMAHLQESKRQRTATHEVHSNETQCLILQVISCKRAH